MRRFPVWLLVVLGLALFAPGAPAAPGEPAQSQRGARRAPNKASPGKARPGRRGKPRAAGEDPKAAGNGQAARTGQAGAAMRAAIGNSFMRQGSAQAAVLSFQTQLAKSPDSAALHIGLAKALTKIGRCDEALDHFRPYVGTKPFGSEAAFAAANCSSRLGLRDEAILFDRIAVDLDPTSARALTSLALDLAAADDVAGTEEALEALAVIRPDRDASWYARAVLALRIGDLDTFDVLLHLWRRDDPTSMDLRRLEALAWMDLDDPKSAYDELHKIRSLKAGKQIRTLRAESLRRMGFAEEAVWHLEDRPRNVLEGHDADALRARVAVDLGHLDDARALLAPYGEMSDADFVASEWYLAKAEGDAPRAADAAARFLALNRSPLRTLDDLIPIPRAR